jgi:hypothetical protein
MFVLVMALAGCSGNFYERLRESVNRSADEPSDTEAAEIDDQSDSEVVEESPEDDTAADRAPSSETESTEKLPDDLFDTELTYTEYLSSPDDEFVREGACISYSEKLGAMLKSGQEISFSIPARTLSPIYSIERDKPLGEVTDPSSIQEADVMLASIWIAEGEPEDNKIKKIDVSTASDLHIFRLYNASLEESLNFSKNERLTVIEINSSILNNSVKMPANPSVLRVLEFYDSSLKFENDTIDLTECKYLRELKIGELTGYDSSYKLKVILPLDPYVNIDGYSLYNNPDDISVNYPEGGYYDIYVDESYVELIYPDGEISENEGIPGIDYNDTDAPAE